MGEKEFGMSKIRYSNRINCGAGRGFTVEVSKNERNLLINFMCSIANTISSSIVSIPHFSYPQISVGLKNPGNGGVGSGDAYGTGCHYGASDYSRYRVRQTRGVRYVE